MDTLRAYILILHAKTARDGFPVAFRKRTNPMTPKVQGIASAMAKLRHNLDDRAEKLLTRIENVDKRGATAFGKAHGNLDASEASLADVEKFVADLEDSNGAPSDGSQGSSVEPKDSWKGDKKASA